jgi:hypothetical protein
MLPRRAVPRTLTPQVVEEDVDIAGFVREVATAVRQMIQVVFREDGSSLLKRSVKLHPCSEGSLILWDQKGGLRK